MQLVLQRWIFRWINKVIVARLWEPEFANGICAESVRRLRRVADARDQALTLAIVTDSCYHECLSEAP